LAKKFSNISEYRNCTALAEKCKQLVTKKKGEKMPENKLMDKLVAGFNYMYQSMQSQINKLNFEIKRLESEDNEVVRQENVVTDAINNYPPFVPYPGDDDWQTKREYKRWSEGQSELLDKRKKLRDSHYDLVKEHDKLVAERDSLSKKLVSLSSLSAEAKGETYYRWLVKNYDAAKSEDFAKSETEYTALAKKFSDISGYKDCAALAVKCKELAEEAKRTVQMQAAIAELNKEYSTKLKPLDNAIAAIKKKLPDFKKTLTVSSIVGAVIGCILFFAATDYPDKGEFAGSLGLWLGSGVVALFCFGWKPGGCLAWLSAIVFVILTLALVFGREANEFWLMTGIWLLYLLGGAIVSALLCYLYKNNKKRIIQQEIANLGNQKSALRSEYDRKKEEVRKNYQSL
jgi:hypothetical protein